MSTYAHDAPLSQARGRLSSPKRFRVAHLALAVTVLAAASGCTSVSRWVQQGFKVGPDYCRPPAPVADNWIDFENPDVESAPTDYSSWWSIFGDPVLDQLIDNASQQNLTLQTAGMRILEARARLGIARGSVFPQIQQAYGDFARTNKSATTANVLPTIDYDTWDAGFNASWELDFWGRFRRAIEAEDALLNAEIENYDNVLVVLQAEVAAAYIQYRTFQRRLELAKLNVEIQQKTYDIAKTKADNDRTIDRDPALAKANMAATQALIPEFESRIRQTGNAICVLLGVPPRDLTDELGQGKIPSAPAQIVVGIPAELLRRRPDVRRAERLAAAQSAVIGVAESDFYPRIAITGFIGFESEDLANLFDQASLAGSIGPGFQWNILNYGRIRNNVRANEARFDQLVLDYQNTVLEAGREVEDGIISFLKERERVVALEEAEAEADSSVKISETRYENDAEDLLWSVFTQELLTIRQDELAVSRGTVAENLVSIYKALGGGWQTRMMGVGMPLEADPFGDELPVEDLAPPPAVDGAPPADPAPAGNAAPPAAPAPPELPPVPPEPAPVP